MDHVITPELAGFESQWGFSHVTRSRGLLFLSGVTGTGEDGVVDDDPTSQFDQAFEHLKLYLASVGAGVADVVEMTTYHVDLRTHFEAFAAVKARHIPHPYPAWSAIGVEQLITPGALVEVRVIAEDPEA